MGENDFKCLLKKMVALNAYRGNDSKHLCGNGSERL